MKQPNKYATLSPEERKFGGFSPILSLSQLRRERFTAFFPADSGIFIGKAREAPRSPDASPARTGLVDVVCNTAFAAGLRGDGTVVSAQLTPDWQYVTALSAGSTALLGLTDEGQVLSHFFRAGDAVDFSGLTRVVAMAAGGTHFAFVHEDGTVTVLGENSNGQCDTAGWQLFA